MKRKLIMRPQAELDLLSLCIYLAQREPRTAERLRKETQIAIDEIGDQPRGFATLSLATNAHIELRFKKPAGFKNYLIIYQVTDDAIFVLRILHSSQDIESALRPSF